jgi:DNA-binding CsgD family transcriptional regulator
MKMRIMQLLRLFQQNMQNSNLQLQKKLHSSQKKVKSHWKGIKAEFAPKVKAKAKKK